MVQVVQFGLLVLHGGYLHGLGQALNILPYKTGGFSLCCRNSARRTLIPLKTGLLLHVAGKGLQPAPAKSIHYTTAIQKLSTLHRAREDNCHRNSPTAVILIWLGSLLKSSN